MGFEDHKQELFSLVQALKTLFLYTQGDKDSFDEYGCNFRSLWDTIEAFGGCPRGHKGLAEGLLRDPTRVHDVNNPTRAEHVKAEEDACKAVRAVLLISGADKR
jgi:hypothetical protein